MAKLHVLLAGAVTLTAGSVMAADASFNNNLSSTAIVSPAQFYQVEGMRTDFAFGYLSANDKDTADNNDKFKGSELFAAAIYDVQNLGLRAGVTASYQSLTTDENQIVNGAKSSLSVDDNVATLSPTVAYPVGPVVVGAAYDVQQQTMKATGFDQAKTSWGTFRPGVTYAANNAELGLAYTSPTNRDAKNDKDIAVNDPAHVILHGRYALQNNLALGAILDNANYSGIDKDNSKDQRTLTGTSEYRMGPAKIEGNLGYATAYYKNKDAMKSDNIAKYYLEAASDYSLSTASTVGGGLSYTWGSDKNSAGKYATNALAVAVRGNMKF